MTINNASSRSFTVTGETFFSGGIDTIPILAASVPEPSTLVLAGIACTILAVWRLWRRWAKLGGAAGALCVSCGVSGRLDRGDLIRPGRLHPG